MRFLILPSGTNKINYFPFFTWTSTQTQQQQIMSRRPRQVKRNGLIKEQEKDTVDTTDEPRICSFHHFTSSDIDTFRKDLLSWYDLHKRNLPWREIVSTDRNTRAYAIWVSEIMLQQTQVATVIVYYNKWMKKWPTLQDLAVATVEEVNTMWSGLGYYSRGRRLLEGAQKVINEMNGDIPNTAEDLQKLLPGVGRYTAGAISSIAFGQVSGLVDGNVMRVLSRLRLIGAYITQQNVVDKFWSLANESVDPHRPGDFNQAIMELGATVCTPKTPSCSQCPVRSLCHANLKIEHDNNKSIRSYTKTDTKLEIPDIENAISGCSLCLPANQKWDSSLGVMNLPRKPPKAKAKQEDLCVLVIKNIQEGHKNENQYCMVQRPEKGLLAGLWEFPMRTCIDTDKTLKSVLSEDFNMDTKMQGQTQTRECGQVTHIFSHIYHNYRVISMDIKEDLLDEGLLNPAGRNMKWISENEMKEAAIPTGMRKVLKLCQESVNLNRKSSGKRPSEDKSRQTSKRSQPSISSFFKLSQKT